MKSPYASFESRKPIIKVIGVGGAGCNVLERIAAREHAPLCIALSSERQALERSSAPSKVLLGQAGLGAGGDPDDGRAMAWERERDIRAALEGAEMVFIAAGMGGGTGSGAAPVVAELAQRMRALTVAVVTTPFDFECGRDEIVAAGIAQLLLHCDLLIQLPGRMVLRCLGDDLLLEEAFGFWDELMKDTICGIADMVMASGLVNTEFADLRAALAGRDVPPFSVAERFRVRGACS